MSTLLIEGGHRLEGRVSVEGNKNAALPLLAACLLTQEECVLTNVPRIGDVEVMAPAFNRANGYQSLTVRLKDPSTIRAFDEDLQRNPSMQVQAASEFEYYEKQAGTTATVLVGLAVKLGSEDPLGDTLRHAAGWDIAIAPLAHATGAASGLLCALLLMPVTLPLTFWRRVALTLPATIRLCV